MTAASSAMAELPKVETPSRLPEATRWLHQPATTLSVLNRNILPSLGLHSGLGVIAYGIARSTNRVEIKDYLWATGMVANAWYTAVGRHVISSDISFLDAFHRLSLSQQALLGAVTAWGGRLTYRVISRSLRRGKDDPRYEGVKHEPGFWNKASLLFALEAVFQTVISIPFTLPFRTDLLSGLSRAPSEWAAPFRWTAAGLFTAGLALETLADWQIDSHKKQETIRKRRGESGELCRTGVWSIVRHPNYLGDILVHAAFPLWTYGSGLFHLSHLIGPAANYFFLRWIGGDRETEASQSERYAKDDTKKLSQLELYRLQKHSVWPSVFELGNPWTWAVAVVGAAGAAAEYVWESKVMDVVTGVNPIHPLVGSTLAGLE